MIFEFSGSLNEKCIVSPQAQSYCWGESISKICFIVYIEITRSDGWKIKNNECLVRLVIRRSYRTLIYLESMAQPFLWAMMTDFSWSKSELISSVGLESICHMVPPVTHWTKQWSYFATSLVSHLKPLAYSNEPATIEDLETFSFARFVGHRKSSPSNAWAQTRKRQTFEKTNINYIDSVRNKCLIFCSLPYRFVSITNRTFSALSRTTTKF